MQKKNLRQIQIMTGQLKYRQIQFNEADGLRPSAARVRETLFNWLGNSIYEATVLDVFAGSGILGFESISRGAKQAVFIESNKASAQMIQKNATRILKDSQQAKVIQADSFKLLKNPLVYSLPKTFSGIFLDPPYALRALPVLLDAVKIFSPQWVFIEDNAPLDWVVGVSDYQLLKTQKAGQVHYALLAYQGASD